MVKLIFFSHKYWHLLFQNCIQYALRNFLRCITCLYVKNWRCWNSFHIRLIFEFPQPRGCFWRGYATQEADQELKWKLMTLSVWKIWVLEFLGPQSWDTRGGGSVRTPPIWDSTSKSPYGMGLSLSKTLNKGFEPDWQQGIQAVATFSPNDADFLCCAKIFFNFTS